MRSFAHYHLFLPMKHRPLPGTLLLLPLLGGPIGCVSTGSPVKPIGTTTWQSPAFSVGFCPGTPQPDRQETPSQYKIVPTRLGTGGSFAVRSAHTRHGFASTDDPTPSRFIKVFTDPAAEALLIQEVIPNDCAPCRNYLWVRPADRTTFTCTYLQLPSRALGSRFPVDYELPEIVSLQHGQLTYRYTKGASITVPAESLPSAREPTPPG